MPVIKKKAAKPKPPPKPPREKRYKIARNTWRYGDDKTSGRCVFHNTIIATWTPKYITIHMGGWPTKTTVQRIRLISNYLQTYLMIWRRRSNKRGVQGKLVLYDAANSRTLTFVEGKRYPRIPADRRMMPAYAERPKSKTPKRPVHYEQELLPPPEDWKTREHAYRDCMLLGRRRFGEIVIQLQQFGESDFLYEAFIPSPYAFTRHALYQRLRFKSYANAVQAYLNDLVALLEPLPRRHIHIQRDELPFTDGESLS